MKRSSTPFTKFPPEHEAVRAKCFHPSGAFVEFPKEDVESSIPTRFEKIVRMFPDRIAVKTSSNVVTYSQLNAMANSLARAIIARRGAKAEAVAILLDNGARLMAAMLAVLKAGKFFVLLDRSFPYARLANLLEDSQAHLVISDREYGEVTRHFNSTDSNLLELDSIASHVAEENIHLKTSPNSLAAIMYTSGSTGESKGVIWAHRNLLHQVMLFTNAYKLSECDRVSLTTSGTGNAVTIGFLPLLNGATLLPFDVQSHGIKALLKWILQERISICWFGSPLFRNICEVLNGEEKFPAVRIVRLASEATYKSDIELYKQHFSPECLLINGLSNTEAGLICLYPVDFTTEISGQDVPVGYPVKDKEVLLLDDSGKEVGLNRVGEIAIRGRYLSVGYWNRPELTAHKFKSDPNGGDQRIYLSGDLGIRLPDGCLIHKGRKDFRVKVRGYGVETAEVEKVLNRHPLVAQAVVVPRKKETGETRLAAYYTCSGLPTPTVTELRSFLSEQLPDFMIPSMFVMVDTIPLTHSGKLDRRALPAPDNLRPELSTPYLSARNEIEAKLVKIWEEVLDVRPVGVNDGFFDLGGDSLSATRVISQVITHFHLEIPLQSLFQFPTIAYIAALVAQQEGTLSGNDNQDHIAELPLVRVSREGLLPLSFSQQRLWFLDQLDPGSFTYNIFSAYRLKGELNVAALEQSFNEIIRRHEVLRTVFKAESGNPVQVVLPNLAITIPVLDLKGTVSEEDKWTEVRRLAKEEAQRPFSLASGPLLRITLLRLSDDEYLLFRAMHHITADAWSGGVLFRELATLYKAYLKGQPSPLGCLPIQYADYAVWQRQWFQGETLESQLAYWKKQLQNVTPLNLPTDRPRPAVQSSHGARQYFTLSYALSSELKEMSNQQGATLFMTLLAAFQTLLHRYSGQTDIVIGSPVAGRNRIEFESLIGFFLNTLVLRLDLSGNPKFTEVLDRVREVCLGTLSYQELPFEKLVEELNPDRNLSQNPLFQVIFSFQNTPRFPPCLFDVAINEVELEPGIARCDLHIFMEEIDGHLQGYCDYDTNLFNADTIERLLSHFQTLLNGIVEKSDQRISELPILTDAEKHQLLIEWNDTRRDYPKNKCIHELFEEQVEKSPDAIAVIFEDQRLTYRELNIRANQLAHYLRKLSVGPESLVAICLDRSIEMIIALLGILKAGGAYVPLDPTYPQERLAFMLEDTGAAVVVTQKSSIEDRGWRIEDSDPRSSILNPRLKVVCLESDWEAIGQESIENLSTGVSPDNLTYVIYTSGSTGVPKGVEITHSNVVRLFRATDSWFHFGPDDAWTLFHSYAFDFSVWELWGALLHGGRLVVVSFEVSRSPREFYELLCREQVTVLNQTPSAFRQLMQAEESVVERDRLRLRRVIFGGEALDFQSLKPWFERHGDQKPRLINMYGITETTVHVSYREITEADADAGVPSLIGAPIPDLEIYILDPYHNLVPVGVPGELYVGGAGLGRGYLNRGELTAERFIDHSFGDGKVKRLYRSGDLVRRRGDGDVEYLGRIDDQVKIRGYRIELGEIESVLDKHPGVREAVVLAREDASGDKRLVAYVVAASQDALFSELRSFVKARLPDYMVPSAFVLLDALPLTPNGKVDRKALLAPEPNRPELEQSFEAPQTLIEEIVAQIWAEVLKVEKVGVHDNFFDLGGHSLLAAQLVSRIRDAFRIELPLRNLFEAPTVGGVANHIELFRQQTAGLRTLPIVPEVIDGECPLSFAQERFWFLEQLEPNNSAYHATYEFHLVGPLNIEALEKALSEMVRRHETLRTTFHVRNGKPVQVISEQWSSPLEILDLRQHPPADRDAEVQRIFESEYRCTFDLSRDLLLRATLLQLGTDEHVLLLNSHHIAWDHWCMDILFREVALLYRAYVAGEPSPFPDPKIQYRHYALWQRNVFDRAELQDHLTYWKEQLRGVPQSLNLPTDHPRKPLRKRRGGRERRILPKSLTDGLRTLSREASVTLFMTFLAAFQTLLHRITHQDDIVVGTPVAGRDRSETEGLIGLFLNSLALRTDLSDNPTFFELLRRVREVALGAYDHQDLPFEKLVEELQPKRDLTRTPIFQVFINMYNFKESTLELDGLSVQRLHLRKSHSQFDITLFILEQDEGTELSFQYDADLFEHSTIVRMLGNFKTLLKGIVAHPDHRISDFPILTDAERYRLLIEWNDTGREYPKDKCIHQLFEEQVEKSPDAVAVVFEDQQLSYRELNLRANQLAHYLRKLGVGPESLVAICLDRSVDMVVALLGILKAGGAYVPLDPSYPRERLAFMLEDTEAGVVVTQSQFVAQLPELTEDGRPMAANNEQHGFVDIGPRFRMVCLDTDWEKINLEDGEDLSNFTTAENLAYVIYTSGSTGTPKGVMIRHCAISNHMLWMQEALPLHEGDRVLQKTPFSFDASIWEFYAPLLAGARLVMAPPGVHQDSASLVKVLAEQKVTVLQLVPSMLRILVEEEGLESCQNLRRVFCGGEVLPFQLTERFAGRSKAELYNLYGPTEATIDVTYGICGDKDGQSVSIGRPIANMQVYILDSYLQPVPIGVVGELYIGGTGLACGYLNRPELTAEKFIPNPFSGDPSSRLYRTGDLARYLPYGNIEFLGRIDNQVKIRGYRIELGEIETILSQHPRVREAVVLAREDSPGERRLVAYVVAAPAFFPSASELRSFLKQKLPEYMVPSAFVFLDALPLTPNGKLDRTALPAPDLSRPELEQGFVAPRTPLEEIIAQIWAEVLKVEKVGIHDNFFDLGGHSLLATQVISRIREALQVDLPLRVLFEAATVAELAERIEQRESAGDKLEELACTLAEVELLSEEEAERRLVEENS